MGSGIWGETDVGRFNSTHPKGNTTLEKHTHMAGQR